MTNTAPILEVHDLVKDFGGVRAVDHCSLRIKRGAITGIIGPNGAGKTTLFNLVSGAMSPTSGQVIFDGRRIDKMGMHQTFGLGLVRTFQIPREMKRMTVLENLMLVPAPQTGEHIWASWLMPLKVAREERQIEVQAMEVLELLTLSHLADEYAGNLSGGQKKLLELARVLMAKPKMVLLDEPGAGVNRTLVAVQHKCPSNCSAEMSPVWSTMVSDGDIVDATGDRRVGGLSASTYLLTVSL